MVDVEPIASTGHAVSDGVTVKDLALELGYNDKGRAVRASLRKGFPDHVVGRSWDPLSAEEEAHVRVNLSLKR